MKVEILSRKLIRPSNPTPHHLRILKTSFIDRLSPPSLVPLIYYYPPPPPAPDHHQSSSSDDDDNDVDVVVKQRCRELETSLAHVLTLFYPLAGRLEDDDHVGSEINCNDQGAEYCVAQVSARLDEFMQRGKAEPRLLNLLVPTTTCNPMAAVQVNVFSCGGLAITVCESHKIADGFTGTYFINAWAIASRSGIDHVPPPCFVLATHLPEPSMLSSLLNQQQSDRINNSKPNVTKEVAVTTRIFTFEGNALSALKKEAAPGIDAESCGVDGALKRPPSRLEVVSALVWRALIG